MIAMKRDDSVDILKGIGILCVLLGHITLVYRLRGAIYTFHMPLFFIASGYFFRHRRNTDLAYKLLCSMGIPFLIFALLNFVFQWIVTGDLGNFSEILLCFLFADGWYNNTLLLGNIPPLGILWFFPALIICRLTYNALYNYQKNRGGKNLFHLSVLISIVSIILGKYIINLPLGVFEGGQALLFYWVGHQYAVKQEYIDSKRTIKIFLIVAWIFSLLFSYMSMADFSYGCWPLNAVGAIGATWVLYQISKYLSKRFHRITNIFQWFGQMSLYILGGHILLTTLQPCYAHILGDSWILIFIFQLSIASVGTAIYMKLKSFLIKTNE